MRMVDHSERSYIRRAICVLGLNDTLPAETWRSLLSRPPEMHGMYFRIVKLMGDRGLTSYQAQWLAGKISPEAM